MQRQYGGLAQTLFLGVPNHDTKSRISITSMGITKGDEPLSSSTSSGSLEKSFGVIRRIKATANIRTTFGVPVSQALGLQ